MSEGRHLIRVEAPPDRDTSYQGFVAGAEVYKDEHGYWQWGRIAPILGWWRHQSPENISMWLRGPARAKGWRYQWITPE